MNIISLLAVLCLVVHCQAAHITFPHTRSSIGSKPELEFFDTSSIPWQPLANTPKVYFKLLSQDSSVNEDTTILYKYEHGLHLPQIIRHGFWEEVYLLDGEIYDERLGKKFGKGFYACRPPGMPHGPYKVLGDDCIMLVTTRKAEAKYSERP